jgi:hypothetical protein
VHYLGLDVHQETIGVAIAPETDDRGKTGKGKTFRKKTNAHPEVGNPHRRCSDLLGGIGKNLAPTLSPAEQTGRQKQ